jgi:hypothetical protein
MPTVFKQSGIEIRVVSIVFRGRSGCLDPASVSVFAKMAFQETLRDLQTDTKQEIRSTGSRRYVGTLQVRCCLVSPRHYFELGLWPSFLGKVPIAAE